ncbi:mechanosensitive ion channel family protein [Cumulibacter soli]|uniref:mechanosensitive ion channel family protein n=1 Tax=Cumulibacter soli TaxID=2546344 RepID=UPI001067E464|nr:mechanosensitive ion channel domain-containing protein [Cumulibacter soli]
MTIEDIVSPSEVSAWDIAFAVATLLLTWVAFRVSKHTVNAALAKVHGISENLRLLIVRAVKYLVLFLGVGFALSFLGAQIRPVLVVVIVIAALAFLVLRGVADNFGAGIVLQSRKPVDVGDEVESHGYVGTVTSLNGRSVLITTTDGRIVHVPNALILAEPLVNHTRFGRRRSEVEVRCELVADGPERERRINQLRRVLSAAAASTPNVLTDPMPTVLMLSIERRKLTMLVRYWTDPVTYVPTTSAVVSAIGRALDVQAVAATVTSQRPEAPYTRPPAI